MVVNTWCTALIIVTRDGSTNKELGGHASRKGLAFEMTLMSVALRNNLIIRQNDS